MKKTTFDDVARMVRALAQWRADSREEWIKVGMTIHSFDPSAAALSLWEEFSQRSDKFKPGECAKVWNGFKAEKGRAVSVGSLSMMAMQDGAAHQQEKRSDPKTEEKKKLWQSAKEAEDAFYSLTSTVDDEDARAFLEREYGLTGGVREWHVFEHPTMGRGIVYQGVNLNGVACYKFKSLRRNEKGKRLICYLYGHGGCLFLQSAESRGNVIVGGEEKAEAVRRAGFNAVCPLTGENAMSPEWAKYFASSGVDSMILANDADKAGAEANRKSAEALDEAGISDIRIVGWPPDVKEGYDLNDALKEAGIPAVTLLLSNANRWEPDTPGLDLWNIDRLFAYKTDESENILGDYLLSAGEMALLIGPPDIGKSRLSCQLIFDILLGRAHWLNELPILRNDMRILLLQTENSQRRLQIDFGAQLKGCSLDQRRVVSDRLRFHVPVSLADRDISLDRKENVTRLARTVRNAKPDIVLIDPYIDLFAGDSENDSVQTRRTVQAIFEFCHAWSRKTAILVVHHSKPGREAAAGAMGWDRGSYARGSKALMAAARSQINVAPGDEEGRSLVIACGKNNNGKKFTPFAVSLGEGMVYQKVQDFDAEKWKTEVAGRKRGSGPLIDPSSVFCRLPEDKSEVSSADVVRGIMDTHGCAERSAQRAIARAVESGKITVRKESYGCVKRTYLSLK